MKAARACLTLDWPDASTKYCFGAKIARSSGTLISTPLNEPAGLAVVRPTSIVCIVNTTDSLGWNPSPLTLIVLPAGPLNTDRKMFASTKSGKLNVGKVNPDVGGGVAGAIVGGGVGWPSQTPTARQIALPQTGELIKATTIGTIHGALEDEPSDIVGPR